MGDLITVAIPTFNRAELVERAIGSVRRQNVEGVEIIVVDDGSVDGTPRRMAARPDIRYIRLPLNRGPGAARNVAVKVATSDWVVMLDDDDVMVDGGLTAILDTVRGARLVSYPVLQFAGSNAHVPGPFLVGTLRHYLCGEIKGDFVPVINCRRFLDLELAYPEIRVGAEHLLWWTVAEAYGIPTWSLVVVEVKDDASSRLTSVAAQIRQAHSHAEAQEETLARFGTAMRRENPWLYRKKQLAMVAYWLLAGERVRARECLRKVPAGSYGGVMRMLGFLSMCPRAVIVLLFKAYRRISAQI